MTIMLTTVRAKRNRRRIAVSRAEQNWAFRQARLKTAQFRQQYGHSSDLTIAGRQIPIILGANAPRRDAPATGA